MFKKLFFIIASGLLLTSCEIEETNDIEISDTERFRIVKLFEVDSISVYRFYDTERYEYVYFTNRKGEVYHQTTRTSGTLKSRHIITENHQTLCN